MVTPRAFREFALDCLGWAQAADPSNRYIILAVALSWGNTADALERHLLEGGELRDDLRTKLN